MKRKMARLACILAACSLAVASVSIPVAAKITEALEENVEKDLTCYNMDISIQTVDKIVELQSGKNIMFSPTSLNFALGMLQSGAEENSKDALSDYLGTDDFASYAKSYMNRICDFNTDDKTNDYQTKLSIANAVWVDNQIALKDEFEDTVSEYFSATIENLEFSKAEEASKIINDWCDEKTEHLIPEIVTPDALNNNTGLCLTNSLYFEAGWDGDPWTVEAEEDDFGSNGEKTTYMTCKADQYYENDQATAFARSYINGLQFIGILPKEDGDFTLEDLDIPGLLESKPDYASVNARMPKLDYTTSVELTDILSGLGLEQIFSNTADFSGISDVPTFVSSIIQKTNLQLDENGTKAAAVTAAMIECMSALSEEEPKEVNLNRPFVFLIYDAEVEEPLFVGKVVTMIDENSR